MSAIPQTFREPIRSDAPKRPRLGFVGVGWIGTHRLKAVAASGVADIVAVADPNEDAARNALSSIAAASPDARLVAFDELFATDLDGLVIATPNATHAQQTQAALERGLAVFCQKPLARTAQEARELVETARRNDRLLGVDFCYRKISGIELMRAMIAAEAIGEVFAADLVFHNAYGPDKPWFYDVASAGGGCVMDLGIHLIDLLSWVRPATAIERVNSRLYREGALLPQPSAQSEDYALADLHSGDGFTARLACSWRLSAGCDAVIEATFYGTRGALRLRNIEGSFYQFCVEHCEGTRTRTLTVAPTTWGDSLICEWAQQLSIDRGFDREATQLTEVHRVLDAIYGR